MSVEDYFTMNCYKGKIYKTTNMLGKTLAQYCTTDSAMNKEQRKIENELKEFEKNIFGNIQKRDSLDSISAAKDNTKAVKARSRRTRRSAETTVTRSSRRSNSSGGTSNNAARVSVRRQRH